MSIRKINFDNKKLKKSNSYKKKTKKINIDYIDVNQILLSKKEPYGKNNSLTYFIQYNDIENIHDIIDVIRPLCLKLSKMGSFINKHENKNTITMSARVNDEQPF